jgi:hypothetical protein
MTSAQGDLLIAAVNNCLANLHGGSGNSIYNAAFSLNYASVGVQWCFGVLLVCMACLMVLVLRRSK